MSIRKFATIATTAAIGLFFAWTESASALQIYTDRATWQAQLQEITRDRFSNFTKNASSIRFSSGVVSVGTDGYWNNLIWQGEYIGTIVDQDNSYEFNSITWTFPRAIFGFGATWSGTTDTDRLTITGNFDGTGNITVRFSEHLPNGDGFLGIIGGSSFNQIVFGTEIASGEGEGFSVDNLLFSSTRSMPASTPIPTPALLPGAVAMSLAMLRKRKQEALEQQAAAE